MAHAEYGSAVRPGARGRAAGNPESARIAIFPERPIQPPRSEFPELDPVRHLVDAGYCAWSERRATALATGADRVLIAAGVISEDDYLAAFSKATGIPVVALDALPRSACLLDDGQLIAAAAAEIMPISRDGSLMFLVAPRGTAARRLAQAVMLQPSLAGRIGITSGAKLQGFIVRHGHAALAERAAEALRTASPMLSAAQRPRTTGRWRIAIATAGVGAFALTQPIAALAALDTALSATFLAWIGLRLIGPCLPRRPAAPAQRRKDADLPVYTVIAAIYREAAAVGGLIASLRQFDWPAEKMDVKLVVEADDGETRDALARLDLDPRFEIVVAPKAGPRTKPKALNAALPFARGTFTVIYDAEDRPEPDQLRVALEAFLADNQDLACVQAALTIDNTADSWLARGIMAQTPQALLAA